MSEAKEAAMAEARAATAESMPVARKIFKALAFVAFCAVWIGAMFMTFNVMLARSEGEPWFVALGLVALGLGADLWVGAGPIILRSSMQWGVKVWTWIGWVALVVALLFSYTNKVAYWVERSNHHEAMQIASTVDTLETDRALVAANPNARVPAAVAAERDGLAAAAAAKREEIGALPPTWAIRRREAQRELLSLTRQHAALAGEYETAVQVAEAKARIDAARVDLAVAQQTSDTEQQDPVLQWLIALGGMFGLALTTTGALALLHAGYALFHELAQFSFLGLATLRIPIEEQAKEQRYIIEQNQIAADKRVALLHSQQRRTEQVKRAQASFEEVRKNIKPVAVAQAQLETKKRMWEVDVNGDRADLDYMRAKREVARERRAFELEGSALDINEHWMIPDLSKAAEPTEEEVARQERSAQAVDVEFKDAVRSIAAQKGWDTRRARVRVKTETSLNPRTGKMETTEIEPGTVADGAFRQAYPAKEAAVAMAAAGVVMAPSMAAEALSEEQGKEESERRSEPQGNPAPELKDDAVVSVIRDDDTHTPEPTITLSDEEAFLSEEERAAFAAPAGLGVGADGKDGVIVDEEPEQYGPPAPVRQLEEA